MAIDTAPDPRRWKALAVLGIAYLMVVLDVSIVNVALPSIQEDLDFSTENLQWVVSGYALTFGGFLLLGGRIGRPARAAASSSWSASRSSRVSSLLCGPLAVVRDAHRRAAAPGRRRRDPLAVGLLDHARHLRGGRRAEQGARHPRRDRRLGRRHRRAPRRRPHRVRRLGVDLLRQRPDRPASRSSSSRASCARAGPTGWRATSTRSARVTVTGEPHAPRLRRSRRRTDVGWTLGPDDRRRSSARPC